MSDAFTGPEAPAAATGGTRRRLEHVDAMRPVKQLGVVSTHSLIAYGHGLYFGAALILLHVSREAFLFVSACMLTYAYRDFRATPAAMASYWRRRAVMVLVPYLSWTLIYFFIELPTMRRSPIGDLGELAWLCVYGYSQLYFIVVLAQFYLLFPLVLWLLRRLEGHHRLLVAASVAIQLAYTALMHWGLLPVALTHGTTATREVMSYQLYLLAGCVAAWHYEAFHRYLTGHARLVVVATIGGAALAEAWYFLAADHVIHGLGSASDPFQPIVLPFNLAAIALVYLAGVALARPRPTPVLRRLARAGSDNSFAVYLSQVAFLEAMTGLGFASLERWLPWPVVVGAAVVIVFFAGCAVGAVGSRLPGARALTGRSRAPWPPALLRLRGVLGAWIPAVPASARSARGTATPAARSQSEDLAVASTR